MSLTTKTLQEIQQLLISNLLMSVNTGQTDIKKQIDPTLKNSMIGGIVSSLSAGFDDNNQLLKEILRQLFPQTATGDYLKFWGQMRGLSIKSSSKASGYIDFTGTATTEVPTSSILQKSDGTEYETLSTATISTQSINITSLTRIGDTAIATTANNHNLATGLEVIIAGADQADYNITASIIVVNNTQFSFTVANAPTTPATGTINATATFGRVAIICRTNGTVGNLGSGSQLELVSPIENVNDFAIATYEGIFAGFDAETEDEYRTRVLQAWSNNTGNFTDVGIEIFLKNKITAITRVWVYDATPSAGYVSIYFVNDNELSILPNSTQIAEAKAVIVNKQTGIKPANTDDAMVLVYSPTPYYVDFTFSSLTPNTPAMRLAITERLTDYFRSAEVSLGKDIKQDTYKNVIFSAIDEAGNSPTFTLSLPSADIDVASNELPILRNITF